MNLCFACLHQFPHPNLTQINISESSANAFHTLRNNVTKLKATATAAQKRLLGQIEDDIKGVLLAVEREIKDREDQMKLFMNEAEGVKSGGQGSGYASLTMENTAKRSETNMTPTLPRVVSNVASSAQAAIAERNIQKNIQQAKVVANQWSVVNRFGQTVSSSHRKSSAELDTAAAALKAHENITNLLYLVTEGATAITKAEKAFVWLTSEGGDELVASIMAGVEVKRGMVPLRVNAASGIVGAVVTTGIAVNATLDEPQTRSVLCMPIGSRVVLADGTATKVHGALQIVNKCAGEHFTEDDEAHAVQSCALLNHVLSCYSSSKTEIVKKLFDPSALASIARFRIENTKVKDELLSLVLSHRPSTLLYRSWLHTATLSRNDMQQKASPMIVCAGVKEVHHFIGTLESSWKSSVASIEAGQRREKDLETALEHARQEVASLKHQNERVSILTRRVSLYGETGNENILSPSTPAFMTPRAPQTARRASDAQPGSRRSSNVV